MAHGNKTCGCVNCNPHALLAAKGEVRGENHMEIFSRLSRIVIMHGTPGAPKGKGGSGK